MSSKKFSHKVWKSLAQLSLFSESGTLLLASVSTKGRTSFFSQPIWSKRLLRRGDPHVCRTWRARIFTRLDWLSTDLPTSSTETLRATLRPTLFLSCLRWVVLHMRMYFCSIAVCLQIDPFVSPKESNVGGVQGTCPTHVALTHRCSLCTPTLCARRSHASRTSSKTPIKLCRFVLPII